VTVVSDVLLGAAVIVVLLSSIGILVMKDTYQRVHFVTPISIVATLLVALALSIREGWDESTGATWLALGFVALASPYLSHATLRTARIRQQGDWKEISRKRRQEAGRR
jgi:multisubunit Na+/H+ antiporter MnhG subunit